MSSNTCSNGHQNPDGANYCLICGQFLYPSVVGQINVPPTLQTGKKLRDRYIIQRQLGQGGFGRTYLIEDTGRFNEPFVLKEFVSSFQGTYALEKAVELFQREAVMLYQLQHPQIPKFWETFQAESRLFLVQDFMAGQTYHSLLQERLRCRQCFSEAEILRLFRDLLPVLNYIHHQGVIHRDISPDNIILSSKTGLPILIDLGAAKQVAININHSVQANPAPPVTTVGKLGYAPDEQMRLGIVSPNSDLYALAVTAIVLMTGKQPQQLLDQYTMKWNWEPFLNLDPLFAGVINRMLAPRSDQRFQSANEVLQALFTTTPPSPPPISNPPAPVNNSGCGKIFDASIPVPYEIKGWNWGAFLLGLFWSLGNKVWIGALCIVPYVGLVMVIVLGVKGNEWAWKSRRWASIEQFKAHQRAWTVAGLVVAGIFVVIGFLIGLSGS